jgi:hypothetical protein
VGALGLIDGFVHPALAAGALLAAVPLLIHLLNRQRHRPMPWAAMRFVQAAWKRTRRRARFENLILLLLRMAAVALLAFAVARPFAGGSSPLAGLTDSRRDLVLALDGSASTGWRGSAQSVFEQILERARAHLNELDGGRGDRVRLFLCGAHPRLLSWRSPEEALELLSTLAEPTDEPFDLAAALAALRELAAEDARANGRSALEIRLLTDLQRHSFDPPPEDAEGGSAGPSAIEELDQLRELGARVLVEDLGPAEPQPQNLAVTEVALSDDRLALDLPAEVQVRVQNFGPQTATGVRLALEVDGERRPARVIEVPGRGEVRAAFDVSFSASGDHTLLARLDSDRLTVDDARALAVRIPPPLRVLLVDGEPAFEIDRDETGYLALALAPPADDGPGRLPAPFQVEVVEPSRFGSGETDLANFDVIVLANVPGLSPATQARLEQRVAAGAGLLITVGDGVASNVQAWNRLFSAVGAGLLPAELTDPVPVADRRRDWWRVKAFQEDHPALRFFADERWKALLTEVPIYSFLGAKPLPDARVLASLDDPGASPLLVERSYDRGRVFLWLTTIDAAWARVAESPRTLVPLVHELVRYAGTPDAPALNVALGTPFVAELASYPQRPVVLRPDGARRPLEAEPSEVAPGVWRLPPVTETDRAGLYRVELEGAPAVPFAVQFDADESDLERLEPSALEKLHPALVLASGDASDSGDVELDSGAQGELWRALAIACLAALVGESLWAAWIGRRRSGR